MTDVCPVPFDPLHDAATLIACGYECTHYPEYWIDTGGPENGPHIEGHRAFDEWRCGSHVVIVEDEEIVYFGDDPISPSDFGHLDDIPF